MSTKNEETNQMTEFNYHEDTAIDPDELLEEWLSLPGDFYDYTRAAAEMEKKTKIIWEKMKTIRSQLILKAKTDEGLGNPKATAGEVEAYYRTQPEYQKAKVDLINIEFEKDMVQNAVQAFYRKEKALAAAVALNKMEWWRGPKEPLSISPGKRTKHRFQSRKSVEKRQRQETNRRRRK
jgi:hypothetical protein